MFPILRPTVSRISVIPDCVTDQYTSGDLIEIFIFASHTEAYPRSIFFDFGRSIFCDIGFSEWPRILGNLLENHYLCFPYRVPSRSVFCDVGLSECPKKIGNLVKIFTFASHAEADHRSVFWYSTFSEKSLENHFFASNTEAHPRSILCASGLSERPRKLET